MKKPPAPYTALRQPVLAKLKAYRRDFLVHDRRAWRLYPGVEFLHFTRDNGTTLVILFPHDHPIWPAEGVQVKYLFGSADRWHILRQVPRLTDYECNPIQEPRLIHHGRSGHVVTITPEAAIEIARNFERATQAAWNRKIQSASQQQRRPVGRYEMELEAA